MDYIDQIFQRTDLREVISFLLYGAEDFTESAPYQERLDVTWEELANHLRDRYPGTEEFDAVCGLALQHTAVVENVYTEIGLQAGIKMAAQIYQNLTPQ